VILNRGHFKRNVETLFHAKYTGRQRHKNFLHFWQSSMLSTEINEATKENNNNVWLFKPSWFEY